MLEPREVVEEEPPPPPIVTRQRGSTLRAASAAGLFVLAAFYTLYFGRSFFLPIVLALLLSFLLSPVVRFLHRLRIPNALGAGLVVFGLLGGLAWGVYVLADPAYQWAEKAPQTMRRLERRLREFKKPVQTVSKATEQVEKITQVGGGRQPQTVKVRAETLGERMFSQVTDLVAGGIVMFILLFFLLASGDLFLRKLIRVMPSLADKHKAVGIARQIETEISAYLVTITAINIGLGLAVWGILTLLEVPNPLLWGVLALVTNYIPYLGAIVMMVVLGMVGILSFEDTTQALMVPLSFIGLNLLESYLVTPLVLGRRLTLNPVVVFVALTFWGWLWGITGAVLAVPIMVVFKIFCDHSEPLRPIGEFLGD